MNWFEAQVSAQSFFLRTRGSNFSKLGTNNTMMKGIQISSNEGSSPMGDKSDFIK